MDPTIWIQPITLVQVVAPQQQISVLLGAMINSQNSIHRSKYYKESKGKIIYGGKDYIRRDWLFVQEGLCWCCWQGVEWTTGSVPLLKLVFKLWSCWSPHIALLLVGKFQRIFSPDRRVISVPWNLVALHWRIVTHTSNNRLDFLLATSHNFAARNLNSNLLHNWAQIFPQL